LSTSRIAAVCLTLVLSTPGLARATAATCDDFFFCFENGGTCEDSDSLMGIALGAVDGIGDLLCFVGDFKCSCFQAIGDPNATSPEFNEWASQLTSIASGCGNSPAGGRSLSGVAFEAAGTVCTPTFAADVAPVLNGVCGPCHVSITSGEFNFKNGLNDLVNVPSVQSSLDYIEPGNPDASYLFRKITGTQAAVGGSGTQMPQGGMLSQQDQDLIRAWILGGARP